MASFFWEEKQTNKQKSAFTKENRDDLKKKLFRFRFRLRLRFGLWWWCFELEIGLVIPEVESKIETWKCTEVTFN